MTEINIKIADISKRKALRTVSQMVERGLISADLDMSALSELERRYAIAMTSVMAEAGEKHESVAVQFVPSAEELNEHPLENVDPIGDDAHSPVTGIVHRHTDRILFMPTMACAVYCRFCFRREKTGVNSQNGAFDAVAALAYIHAHPEIKEVIFTGGDPLVLSAANMKYLLDGIDTVPHVRRIRFHSRVPVVAPYLTDDAKIDVLKNTKKPLWLSIHINTIDELTDEAVAVIRKLKSAGIPLVSQSVLLKGVNDSVEALVSLFDGLSDMGVKPYYLHHMDRAVGTAHFRVPLKTGLALMENVRRRVSGLAIPNYVLDMPGGSEYKIPLTVHNVVSCGVSGNTEIYEITADNGNKYRYEDIK